MVIIGADTLRREDGQAILAKVHELGSKTNILNPDEQWNGINILHAEASKLGQYDLGIKPQRKMIEKPKVLFLLGADDFRNDEIDKDTFVIYLGHSGDEGAYYADIVLPGASYIEKQATYVNLDGRPQQTRAAANPPGFGREDWMILRALSEELGSPLPYDSLDELRTRISEIAPHLVKYDYIEPNGFDQVSYKTPAIQRDGLKKTPLTDNVDNFYMTDAISRHSNVMARCTKELNPQKNFNFREQVQTWLTH